MRVGLLRGRLSFTQRAEPAEQMRIATELGEPTKLWAGGTEISQEVARRGSIVAYRVGAKREGEHLDLRFQDLFQAGSVPSHDRWEKSNALRFSMARAYSRQTSWGASST
jgi:hypothetical protein